MTTAKPETDPTRRQQPLSIDTSADTSSTPAVINDPGIIPSISPTSGQSPARGAERAMSSTSNWKPALDRRQSFSQQEYSHEFHQKLAEEHDRRGSFGSSQGIGAGGFTERG